MSARGMDKKGTYSSGEQGELCARREGRERKGGGKCD